MNKDVLKKYHFWILFAPFLICVLVVVIVLWSQIGPTIEAKQAEHEKAAKDAEAKRGVKPKAVNDLLDTYNARFEKTRVSKWKQNWNMQIGVEDGDPPQQTGANLFRWPSSSLLDGFNYTADGKGLPFGAEIPSGRGEFNEFKERKVYLAEYSSFPYGTSPPADRLGTGDGMADKMWPTQFNGGWTAVLRHVYAPDANAGYGWSAGRPTSGEVWLALEDMWVQRSLLQTLKSVNDRQAEFSDRDPATGQVGQPAQNNHRVYYNRTWKLDLQIVDRADGKKVLVGRLANLTNRVQMFGLGGKIAFKVWLGDSKTPVDLVFNERYLSGIGGKKKKLEGASEVEVPGDSVAIAPDKGVEITVPNPTLRSADPAQPSPVRQVFDTRTVPLQRIDKLVLGYPDSRNAQIAPKMPRFIPVEAVAETAGPSLEEGGPQPGRSSGPASPFGGAAPGGSAGGTVGAGWPVVTGAVTSKTLFDTTKKRYLGEVTPQIRRMPVGMVLIIDQNNLQDLLLALANSPFRFQITQVHWSRFRGTILTESGSGSGGSSGSPLQVGGSGGGSSPVGLQGEGFGGGLGGGLSPGGLRPGGPGPGSAVPSGPGIGAFSGEGADADVQMTSGLIEVSVYGIASLYEKYQPEADAPAAPKL